MTNQRLTRRKKRRERTIAELTEENIRLKKRLVLDRKAAHRCIDASCSICDPERPEDGK